MRIAAVVLAGGSVTAPNGIRQPTAYLQIGDRKLYEVAIGAVKDLVNVTFVIGYVPQSDKGDYVSLLPGTSPVQHLLKVLDWLDDSKEEIDYLLVCPVDQPFLASGDIHNFLQVLNTTQADWIYPAASVRECYSAYPGIKRTSFFGWTGGNVMLFKVSTIRKALGEAEGIYQARKNPLLSIVRALWLVIKHGIRVKLVSCKPSLASDIDKWSQYETACALLKVPVVMVDESVAISACCNGITYLRYNGIGGAGCDDQGALLVNWKNQCLVCGKICALTD